MIKEKFHRDLVQDTYLPIDLIEYFFFINENKLLSSGGLSKPTVTCYRLLKYFTHIWKNSNTHLCKYFKLYASKTAVNFCDSMKQIRLCWAGCSMSTRETSKKMSTSIFGIISF